MKKIKPADRECLTYDFEKYMKRLWEGNIEYHEELLPLENKDGSELVMPLLYRAEKILSVQSATLKTTYKEGTDYQLVDGKIKIPTGSAIPLTKYDYYYPPEEIPNYVTFAKKDGGFIRLFYPPDLHNRQIVVTYIHNDAYEGPVPARKGDKLPKFQEKLKNGEEINIVWYGDSITVGGDTSGFHKVAPNVPVYAELVDQKLKALYPSAKINYINTSKGGMDLPWGVTNVEENVNAKNPDLVILAWGMNTAGLSQSGFKSRTELLMKKIKDKNPDCEFVLVATMLPNAEFASFWGNQTHYRKALAELEAEGVVMANMTDVHEYLITKKRFYDMSGNNVNHCNDYLTRWYAQVVLETMLAPDTAKK